MGKRSRRDESKNVHAAGYDLDSHWPRVDIVTYSIETWRTNRISWPSPAFIRGYQESLADIVSERTTKRSHVFSFDMTRRVLRRVAFAF